MKRANAKEYCCDTVLGSVHTRSDNNNKDWEWCRGNREEAKKPRRLSAWETNYLCFFSFGTPKTTVDGCRPFLPIIMYYRWLVVFFCCVRCACKAVAVCRNTKYSPEDQSVWRREIDAKSLVSLLLLLLLLLLVPKTRNIYTVSRRDSLAFFAP